MQECGLYVADLYWQKCDRSCLSIRLTSQLKGRPCCQYEIMLGRFLYKVLPSVGSHLVGLVS